MNMKKFITIQVAVLFMLPIAVSAEQASDELKFGSVAMDIPAVMHRRLTPLTQYLSKKINRPVSLKLSPNMPAAIDDVATGQVDLAYLTPVAYLKAHKKGNSEILVKTLTKKKGSFQLMIVVRDDSPIKTVEDLAGKSFAFGDKAALLQRAVVVGAGMPLEKLGSYKFIGHYDNIVRGVLNGDFDAGILKDTKVFAWQKKGIRVLYSSEPLPPYNITAQGKLDADLKAKLTQAFLDLDINKPEDKKVITALSGKYDGFARTSDKEYDVVRKLVAPFEKKK